MYFADFLLVTSADHGSCEVPARSEFVSWVSDDGASAGIRLQHFDGDESFQFPIINSKPLIHEPFSAFPFHVPIIYYHYLLMIHQLF